MSNDSNVAVAETEVSNDTILIFEKDGKAVHMFCPIAYAREQLDRALEAGSGGAAIQVTSFSNAELAYDIHSTIRQRVADAKAKLAHDMHLRNVLDKHGVPKEQEVRSAVYKALEELGVS